MHLTSLKIPSRGGYYAYCTVVIYTAILSNNNLGCRNEVTPEPSDPKQNNNVRKRACAHVYD